MSNFPRSIALITGAGLMLSLQGCVAKTAFDVVTAPVRVASKAVDLATESQSEKDEKRGREIRKREEAIGKLERQYYKEREDCDDGDRGACKDAREIYDELQELIATQPPAPEPD